MKVAVKIVAGEARSEEVNVPDGATYYDLLDLLKINPETVVVFKKGIPIAYDAPVDDIALEILRVVSGG